MTNDKDKAIEYYHKIFTHQTEMIQKQKALIEILKQKLKSKEVTEIDILISQEDTTYQDIGGLDHILKEIKQFEYSIEFPRVYHKFGVAPPKGLLMHGPPGCGKTMIAKAMSNELDCWFMELPLTRIISKYVGEAEQNLENSLTAAKKKYQKTKKKVLVFVDEAEQMFKKRGSYPSHGVLDRCVNVWLREMDGMGSSEGLIYVAATNDLSSIDQAILRAGRFDYLLNIPHPDRKAVEDILIKQMKYAEKQAGRKIYRLKDISKLADRMFALNMNGADIANSLKLASFEKIRYCIEKEKPNQKDGYIYQGDIQQILQNYHRAAKKAKEIGFAL